MWPHHAGSVLQLQCHEAVSCGELSAFSLRENIAGRMRRHLSRRNLIYLLCTDNCPPLRIASHTLHFCLICMKKSVGQCYDTSAYQQLHSCCVYQLSLAGLFSCMHVACCTFCFLCQN